MTHPSVSLKYWSIENELQCKCGCGRYNFNPDFLIRLTAFRIMLSEALNVMSGGRCVKHNKDEGGVPTSLHECETKQASAADVTNHNCEEIYKRACISGLFNEVEWHKHDGKNFVHLGWDAKQKGNAFKII